MLSLWLRIFCVACSLPNSVHVSEMSCPGSKTVILLLLFDITNTSHWCGRNKSVAGMHAVAVMSNSNIHFIFLPVRETTYFCTPGTFGMCAYRHLCGLAL
jgi:hypothetical protein